MRIALASLDQQWLDRDENIECCNKLLEKAAKQGCELVIFPEMTLTGYSLNTDIVSEAVDTSISMRFFRHASDKYNLHIIFGVCLVNPVTNQPQNTLCYAEPKKDTTLVYKKIHPFSFAGEDKVFEAGDKLGFIKLKNACIGASVCYDLRFPELYTALAPYCKGVVCIASWPEKRIKHWQALLVARAIENQMFMIGVNRIGVDGNGLSYKKSSVVVSPSGRVLKPAYSANELDVYNVNMDETTLSREEFPTLQDKRPLIYENL